MNYNSSNKIKLLFIIDFINGITGGTESQLIKLIENLNCNKYQIYLLCLQDSDWIQTHKINLPCEVKIFNIYKLRNPLIVANIISVIQYIKSVNPTIVLTFFPLSNILGVLTAKTAGVNMILSSRRDYGLWLKSKIGIYFLKFANKYVECIITNSENVKKLSIKMEGIDQEKIFVIYNGIDTSHFYKKNDPIPQVREHLHIPAKNKIVGILAGLRPMKKHATFIRTAAEVLKIKKDVSFLIVGDGPLRANLEELTIKLRIQDSIHFLGWQQNIYPYLSLFDLGINCSAAEGLSNAIMEYMALGVPCIVADAGGNPELITHGYNGYTFELDNYQKLTQLILNLLYDINKQNQFALRSKERINKMTINTMIANYDKCFSKLLNVL